MHVLLLVGLALVYVAGDAVLERTPIILGMASDSAADELVSLNMSVADMAAGEPDTSSPDAAAADAPEPFATATAAADTLADVPPPEWEAITADASAILEPLTRDGSFTASVAALDPAAMLAEVGAAGSGAAAHRGPGGGPGGGAGGAGGKGAGRDLTTFFGREGSGRRVCILCDNSNSHHDGGFHAVLDEVARSVESLRPEQSFFVIFFSDAAYPLFHPAAVDALEPATPDNKRRLRAWLGTVEMCSGGQGIHDAVRLAGSLEPDVVYLLSDGEFSGSVVDRVRSADLGDAVVHTLGIQQRVVDRRTGQVVPDRLREQQGFNQNLIAIATAHGGSFTPVNPPPLAATLERLRPIPRNRTRGAVWGLKL